jgi:putative transposase
MVHMSEYRRYFVPGGTYFFTLVTHARRPFLCDPLARHCLRTAIKEIQRNRPFELVAMVLLPDHLHAIWSLPARDQSYHVRWRRIKEVFTQGYLAGGGSEGPISAGRRARGERGIWQRRYWEHTIRDEFDFERHFDYLHYNPVKHGYARSPAEWPHSSFHRWVRQNVYDPEWGSLSRGVLLFDDLDETAME